MTQVRDAAQGTLRVHQDVLRLTTESGIEFLDVTERVAAVVRASGIRWGTATVQTRHTTTAVVVNENEPLLLEDMRRVLERLAPRELGYQHDDMEQRQAVPPDEPKNGHSHCKALFLPTSVTLTVTDGALGLGNWQSVFLVELDGGRDRALAVSVMGVG